MPDPQTAKAPKPVRIRCAMSGAREVLTVRHVGFHGVSFRYNDDLSVIAEGADLLRIRAILDHQIARWQADEAKDQEVPHG